MKIARTSVKRSKKNEEKIDMLITDERIHT